MRYELRWALEALSDLQAVDHKTADRITRKVVWFCAQSDPLRHAEALTGVYHGLFRFRIGDYRAIFEVDMRGRLSILMVLRVKHRREAYR